MDEFISVLGGDDIHTFYLVSGQSYARLQHPEQTRTTRISFRSDNSQLILGDIGGHVELWDLERCTRLWLAQVLDQLWIECIAFFTTECPGRMAWIARFSSSLDIISGKIAVKQHTNARSLQAHISWTANGTQLLYERPV